MPTRGRVAAVILAIGTRIVAAQPAAAYPEPGLASMAGQVIASPVLGS